MTGGGEELLVSLSGERITPAPDRPQRRFVLLQALPKGHRPQTARRERPLKSITAAKA